jgi:hypothetical protein
LKSDMPASAGDVVPIQWDMRLLPLTPANHHDQRGG